MKTTRKSNVLLVLALVLLSVLSCFFGVFALNDNKSAKAAAEPIEYQDYLGLEDRSSWASGGHADIVTLGLMDFSITSGNQYFKSSVSGCWYRTNTGLITTNNNVDILQYVYIDGVSARDLLTENETNGKTTANTGYWLSNPEAWPIAFETGTDCWIRIDKTKFGGDFTFTFKAGFSLVREDGATVRISNDISYTYANGTLGVKTMDKPFTLSFEGTDVTKTLKTGDVIGELPEVPAKDGYESGYWAIDGNAITAESVFNFSANKTAVAKYTQRPIDVTATLGLEDRTSWASGGHADIITLGLMLDSAYFKSFTPNGGVSGCWFKGNDAVIGQNNGVDILEYIYLNGQSARAALNANTQGKATANTTTWLSNPAAWPIAVETVGDVWIRLDQAYFGESFTITLKKGLSIINSEGAVCVVNDDMEYIYANNVLTKVNTYTLSFEGLDDTIMVKTNMAIGELPEVPARDGYVGFWTIDGKKIDENSTVNADKTATPTYALEYQDLLGLEDRTSWAAGGHADIVALGVLDYSVTEGNQYFKSSVNGCWYQGNADVLAANGNVDMLQYVYLDGVSARDLLTENETNGKSTANTGYWLSNPAAWPIAFETGADCWIRIDKTKFGGDFTITFKAGFTLLRDDGEMIYLSNDVTYSYVGGVLTDTSRVNVTFDGANAQLVGIGRKAIAPATVPTKAETESHTYAFDGWYNGETKWNFNDPVTAPMALVAKFIETEKIKYSVTFNADNGSQNSSVSVYVNSYVKDDQIPANPEKTADGTIAYTFVYWSLDGTNAYDFKTPVTQNITLKAIYTTKPLYTVTIGDETAKVIEGEKVAKPADPTKESTAEFDYTFDGWYNGETKWDFENDTVTSDVTLVAKFNETKRSYTVTFNVTGNEAVTLEPVTVEYGTAYDLTNLLEGVDVSAYTYTVTVNGESATSVEVLSDVTVDVTFVARVYYTVTIGGVEQTVEEGEKAVKPETDPTQEATAEFEYIFDGWYNGETKWDFDNDTVTSDVTLVAKFIETKRTYTITFVVTGNDAVILDPVTVEYGTVYDLTNLLEGEDVSGYTYSITVGGVERISVKIIGDTTVTVAFRVKSENGGNQSGSSGCMGTVSGMTAALLGMVALGVAAVAKKKED